MITCSKVYRDIPFAHRQHNHKGHCQWIHGHNWSIAITFGSDVVDENGFIVDFGKLKLIKHWIEQKLDHALLINESDPYKDYLVRTLANPENMVTEGMLPPRVFADIRIVPDGSCEGLAKYFFETFNEMIGFQTDGRVRVTELTVREDSRNSATYAP